MNLFQRKIAKQFASEKKPQTKYWPDIYKIGRISGPGPTVLSLDGCLNFRANTES